MVKTYYFGTKEVLQNEGGFVRGKMHGPQLTYFPDGRLKSRAEYRMGRQHGPEIEYYSNGKVGRRSHYEQGRCISTRYFGADGRPWGTDSIVPAEGTYVSLFPSGKTHCTIDFKNGYRHGKTSFYYPDGTLEVESNYAYGLLQGETKSYFRNAQLNSSLSYVSGSPEGLISTYFINGSKNKDIPIVNGVAHGAQSGFRYDGSRLNEFSESLGKKRGEARRFSSSGELEIIEKWQEDFLVSYASASRDGKPVLEMPVGSGASKIVSFYSNGDTAVVAEVLDGLWHGKHRIYHPNGKLEYSGQYYHGEREGLHRWYDQEGVVRRKTEFLCGMEHGENKRFDRSGALILDDPQLWDRSTGTAEFRGQSEGRKSARWNVVDNIVQPQ